MSFQNGLSTSFSLGKHLSVPIGFSYNKIQGYLVDTTEFDSTKPWFMGDSFMPYIMLQARLPLSLFYIEVFGGGAFNWNVSLTPFKGNIAGDLTAPNEYAVIKTLSFKNNTGYGWVAGAAFGIKIKAVSISVDFMYRSLQSKLELSGTYDEGTVGSSYTAAVLDEPDAKLLIRGVAVGIGGSYEFQEPVRRLTLSLLTRIGNSYQKCNHSQS